MKRLWLSARPLLLLLVTSSLLIAGLAFANKTGKDEFIIPRPEEMAENWLRALHAHRFSAAYQELGQALHQKVSEEQLKEMVLEAESKGRRLVEAHGERSQALDTIALAHVRVKEEDRREAVWTIGTIKESGLWKIATLEALEDHLQQD
jgi:hypothetical protein